MQVEISDSTFSRLQALAIPLVDTLDTVIGRLLDMYDQQGGALGQPTSGKDAQAGDILSFPSNSMPPLRHTKVVSIAINNVPFLGEVSWAGLLREMVRRIPLDRRTGPELKRLIVTNFAEGRKEDDGYRYLPDVGISLQGQDAQDAARGAFHIAGQLGLSLRVEFIWRMKPVAANPGRMAVIQNLN